MRPECSRVRAVFSWRNRWGGGDSSGSLRAGQGSPTAGQGAPSTLGHPPLTPSTSLLPAPDRWWPSSLTFFSPLVLPPLPCGFSGEAGRTGERKRDTGLYDWGLRAAQAKTEMCKVPCRSSSSTHVWAHACTHTRTRAHHAHLPCILSPGIFQSGVRASGLEPVAKSPGRGTCLHSPDLQSGVFGESSRTKFSPPSPSSPESQVLEAVPP